MTLPALILGFVISTAYGVAFHLWRDGGAGRFLLYLIVGWAGFWVGHLVGDRFGLEFLSLGPLHLGMATLGSLVFLFVGHWLSLIEPDRQKKDAG